MTDSEHLSHTEAHLQRALSECEKHLASLMRLSAQFFWETDDSHRLARWAGALSGLYDEIEVGQQIGKTRWDTPSTRPDQGGWQAHRDLLDRHLAFRSFEFARLASDGSERQYAISGEPRFSLDGRFLGYHGVGQDITERQRAEFELRQFRAAIDTTADGIHIVDRETMRLIDANETACRHLGYTRQEFLALSIADFAPNFDAERLAARYDRLFNGEDLDQRAQIVHRHRNGTEIPIEIHRRGVVIDGRRIVVNVVHDISARLRNEQALRESEERFQLVVQGTDDGIWDWNIATGHCYFSPQYRRLLHCTEEDLPPTRAASEARLHPEDRSRTAAALARHLEQHIPYDIEYRLRTASGEYRWFHARGQAAWDETGKPNRFAGALRDITARKETELVLEAANRDLEAYRAIEEEEKRVAKHVLDQLVRVDRDVAKRVKSWILPARYFSGDVVAVSQTPKRQLQILLADGTGHGLAAALGALPAVQPFYAMSQKGFEIGTIAREMNAKIGALLPTGRFIAAALASIDPVSRTVHVWNGGSPACLLIDEHGNCLQRFASKHLALGILPDAQFDSRTQSCTYSTRSELIMISDGLIEARNGEGEMFGEAGLVELLRHALPSVRLQVLRSAMHGHLHYQPPNDDISIVIADCEVKAG
jgi:PAS domain S-box-containing protein